MFIWVHGLFSLRYLTVVFVCVHIYIHATYMYTYVIALNNRSRSYLLLGMLWLMPFFFLRRAPIAGWFAWDNVFDRQVVMNLPFVLSSNFWLSKCYIYIYSWKSLLWITSFLTCYGARRPLFLFFLFLVFKWEQSCPPPPTPLPPLFFPILVKIFWVVSWL